MKFAIVIATTFAVLPLTSSFASPAELAKGKAQFVRCQSCHVLQPSGQKRIGPNLYGIVGKAAGKEDGFRYSKRLAEADFSWTVEKLDEFLTRPRDVIPGTSMVFSGIKDPAARKALISYMESVK